MNSDARTIRIGIHYSCAGQALADSLRAIHENTRRGFELVVIADPKPDDDGCLVASLEELRVEIGSPVAPGGGAASFNKLLSVRSDIYVFLEAGAIPGPGWMDRLLAALDDRAMNGIAGPSTNHCWNEQGTAGACRADMANIAERSDRLHALHGQKYQSMAPTHNLADFAFAMRSEVADRIGGADTRYGRGPCWETDYFSRASLVGFNSIWVPAAFVMRPPSPAGRIADEERFFEINKALYQNRFCGLQHRSGRYDSLSCDHCLGSSCNEFVSTSRPESYLPIEQTLRTNIRQSSPPRNAEMPRISCVMPTRGRAPFVAQSISYFNRQDYPDRELIIVYEHDRDLPDNFDGENIRLVQTRETTIGGKREAGAQAASGNIIAHWDDDDWYAVDRLSCQALPILQGIADITGLNDILFMMLHEQKFWQVTPQLFRTLFVENISGGSLMFHRRLWKRSGPYPKISLREDVAILQNGIRDGARLCRLSGRDLSIYVRHKNNSWVFPEGSYVEPDAWLEIAEPAFLENDRSFYFESEDRKTIPARASSRPLVSCIMPTYNRRPFVATSIQQFLEQDYENRELIILDDGSDNIADLIPDSPMIKFRHIGRKIPLGAKRNMACDLACGDVIAHWDDDDWMAPGWLNSQVETLTAQSADICGLNKMLFYAPETREAWRYIYNGIKPWLGGGTFCYTKKLWEQNIFAGANVGEDNIFIWSAVPKKIAVNPNESFYVAMVHDGNTSPKATNGNRWAPYSSDRIEQLIGRKIPPAAYSIG